MLEVHRLYRFGEFTIDPVAKVVFRGSEPLHLTRRATETLLVLVQNAGQVLTKEEIIREVWGGRVVDEANLAQNIAVVRKALAAAKGTPGWIETFPGRGYRLEGPVDAPSAESPLPPEPHAPMPIPPPALPVRTGKRWPYLAAAGIAAALLLAAVVPRLPHSPPPTADPLPVAPATRLPGREYQPALSPDGATVAFLWSDEGSAAPSVWIAARGSASPQQVSTAQAHHSSPAWSPSGDRLAYLRIGRTRAELVVFDLASRTERVLASLTSPAYGLVHRLLDWSPDGATFAVSSAASPGAPSGIALIDAATGVLRPHTSPGYKASGDVDPRFSPDGSRLTFLRILHRSRQEVFEVSLARNAAPVQITDLGRAVSSHGWLNPSTLVLAAARSGDYRLWTHPAQPGAQASPIGIYSEFPIQISRALRAPVLAYATLHHDRNIWRFDLRDNSWRRILASTAQDASPAYAPDGSHIAFRSDRSGEEQIWVSGATGQDPVQITEGALRPSVARWSPDGRSIVFNGPPASGILTATRAGSEWKVSTTGAAGIHPVFSADGQWIYAGGARLVRIPRSGGTPEVLSETRGEALAVSRDGANLYFVREPHDSTVWRLPLSRQPATPEKVLDNLLPGCTSCWALARDGIYYLRAMPDTLDRQAIYLHPFRPGLPDRLVAEYPEPLWPQGSGPFSLSPDGRYLLVVRAGPAAGDVMLVEPFE